MGQPGATRSSLCGFTLIELMVVIVIIGIIAAIALPNYIKIKNKAKEAEVKANVHNLQLTIERFAVDNKGNYPAYLIGGDNASLVIPDTVELENVPVIMHTDPQLASDPLLREGYVDAYPGNPFVSNGTAVQRFQKGVGDPLRNAFTVSNKSGTRFGPNGDLMGNTLCEARYIYWKPHEQKSVSEIHHTWADVQYEFFDIWDGNESKPFLPGSFFYKSMGEIMGSPDEESRRDVIDMNGKQAILPHNNRDEVTIPLSRSMYMLGAWGSITNKGQDLLGEEPLVIFRYKAQQKKRVASQFAFFFDPSTQSYDMPGVGRNDNKIELMGIPPWTRGVNKGHVGPLWGSPFGPSSRGFDQMSMGNGNGVRDSVILVLMSGVTDGDGKIIR